jgi:RNA-directed DNA polymerase
MLIERMANELGLPVPLESLARAASHEYKGYRIAKRGGGSRQIHHPSRRLKALQRWLLTEIVEPLPVHPAAMAYRKQVSIFDNAKIHASSRFLLRMDFQDFFRSITAEDIIRYIRERGALFTTWSPIDVLAFCGLVCRKWVLTIGAPTSPALSNALCYELDAQLRSLCDKRGVIYTRYADDLFFSTQTPNLLRQLEGEVEEIVSALVVPANLKLNRRKTRHSSRRGARRVTGVVLGSDGQAYIGRKLKRKIRALVHKFESLDIQHGLL